MPGPKISSFSTQLELGPAPINPEWILEGTPSARNRLLSPSTDRFAWTMLWDCTAGKFDWHYNIDETVHVIEGSVTVTDEDGVSRTLIPGSIAFFPKGSRAHWHVENYVRKVAFCQKPVPPMFAVPVRIARAILSRVTQALRQVGDLIRGALPSPQIETRIEPHMPQHIAKMKNNESELDKDRPLVT